MKAGLISVLRSNWPLVVLLSLGSGLRLFRLGSQSLWYDELFQRWVARFPLPRLLEQVAADGQTPPLYYLLTHLWLSLLDWLLPGPLAAHPEFFLRLPSVIFGILLLPVIYRLAQTLFGTGVALPALALCILNPLLVGYAQEARAYSLALLLVALSFLLLQQILTGRAAPLTWLFYITVSSVALYTHYYTVYALFSQSLIFLIYWWPSHKWRVLRRWLVAQGLVGLSFLPWLFIWWGEVSKTSSKLTVEPLDLLTMLRRSLGWLGLGNVEISSRLHFNLENDWPATLLLLSVPAALLLGTKQAISRGKGPEWGLLLIWFGAATFGPALGGQLVKLPFAPRYAIQGTIPLMLALAAAVCWLIQKPAHSTSLVILDKIKNLWPSKPVILNEMKNLLSLARKDRAKPKLFLVSRVLLTSGILLLWIGLMGWGLNNYYFNPDYARPDWRGALTTVADEAQPGDLLLGFPFHHFEVAQDLYLGGKIWPERAGGWSYVQSGALYFPGQHWGGYADFTSPQTAASPDLKADLARLVQPYRRIWLITYSDPTNAAILDWLRDHYQAMPPRYFGPRQTLVLYRFD